MRSLNRGLTIAELVVSVGLLAVVGLALLAAFTAGLKLMQQSTNLTMATDLGREMLENINAGGYAQTALGTFDGRLGQKPDPATGFPGTPYPQGVRDGRNYDLKVRCSQHSFTTRQVMVEIRWGRIHRTKLAVLVHK